MINFANWVGWNFQQNVCGWTVNGGGSRDKNATYTFDKWAGQGRQPRNKDVHVIALRASSLDFHLDMPDDLGQVTYHLWATFPVCKVGIILIAISLSACQLRNHSTQHSERLQENRPIATDHDGCDLRCFKTLNVSFKNGFVCFSEFAWPLWCTWPLVPTLPWGHVYLH